MQNAYVLDLLKTFSPEEMEGLRLFLESPYFNKGHMAKQQIALLQVLTEAGLDPDHLPNDQVYKRVFPDGPVINGKLAKLLSEFKKQLHNFLLTQRYHSAANENQRLLDLAGEIRLRELSNTYKQALERARLRAAHTEKESLEGLWYQFRVAEEVHELSSLYNRAKGDGYIPEMTRALDQYYFTYRLEMQNRMMLQQKFVRLPPNTDSPFGGSWEIPQAFHDSSPMLRICWKIHTILRSSKVSIETILQLRDMLLQYETQIDPGHLKEFYTYLRNVCTYLINIEGEDALWPLLFEIQQDNLARGYFYFLGKISPNAMLNITYIALGLNAIPWAIEFVEAHKDRILGENETRDLYRMNRAICLFAEKKYEAALDHTPFGSSYSFFHLLARRLELKIYYEQQSDLLPYKLDAFKMFIQRAGNNMLAKEIKDAHLNFVNFLRQLSQSISSWNKARSERISQRIQAKKQVADRRWLLEKAGELGRPKRSPA